MTQGQLLYLHVSVTLDNRVGHSRHAINDSSCEDSSFARRLNLSGSSLCGHEMNGSRSRVVWCGDGRSEFVLFKFTTCHNCHNPCAVLFHLSRLHSTANCDPQIPRVPDSLALKRAPQTVNPFTGSRNSPFVCSTHALWPFSPFPARPSLSLPPKVSFFCVPLFTLHQNTLSNCSH